MNVDDVVKYVSIFAPLITLVGIIVSLWVANRSLRELRKDRFLAQKPYLFFEKRGISCSVEFVQAGLSSPGFNPAYIKSAFPNMPPDSISIRYPFSIMAENPVGKLCNYGNGPALDIKITWCPLVMRIGDEAFEIDKSKQNEAKYGKTLNTRSVDADSLHPKGVTGLIHLPMFIEKDYTKQIKEVRGYFDIQYKDTLGNNLHTYQKFYIFCSYNENPPIVHITFSDILSQIPSGFDEIKEED